MRVSGPSLRPTSGASRARPGQRLGASRVALLVVVLLGLPSAGLVRADQGSAALPPLFEELLRTDDATEAARLESRIWQEWFDAPDRVAGELIGRVSSAMGAGDLDLALELADRLVAEAPEFAEAWNRRATLHYLRGEDDLSVADIRETLTLEPRHFGAISGLGMIFLRQGDREAALDAFEQVLRISPASRGARDSVERLRRELGQDI